MQSFRRPRPTTNPYIVQLDRALDACHEIEHLQFSWRRALTTRLDVLHLHWPETLIGGSAAWKRLVRRMLLRALLVKCRLSGTAIVRTAHNVEIPGDASSAERRLLRRIEERADFRILLNPDTVRPWHSASAVIPHGHYADWFAAVPRVDPDPDELGFVGLVRRYKGVEQLIDAFGQTAETAPLLRLRISGNPTSESLGAEVRARAAQDPRVTLDLRYLSEPDFATAVMHSSGIVLPYRFMHNSGSVLAALSLNRPVLVPRNNVNEALAHEVGPGWVHMFDGELGAADLVAFSRAAAGVHGAPDLSARGWERTGAEHVAAYRAAIAERRSSAG
jgi:beta-1,4-mannosyltransferase